MENLAGFKKIDIHCHTTKRKLGHTVSSDASLDYITTQMFKHNIEKTLLLATYFPHKGTGITNFRMRNWIDELACPAGFIMFGSLDFQHYFLQGMSELEEMAERKLIHGVKIYLGYQKIAPLRLFDVVLMCQRYKLPMMFHTGDCTGMDGKFADPDNYLFRQIYEQAPDVNFMFSHMANPMIDKVIALIKLFPNCHTDMSGLLHSGKDDHELPEHIKSVRRFYDECGIKQFMWGTDFPVTTHAHAVEIAEKALHDIVPKDELSMFYYGNAAKILGVS